jgi:hypothetical protein
MDDYEYITEYRGYAIYQDMETGYFYAEDNKGNVFSCEATRKMVRQDIDQREEQ